MLNEDELTSLIGDEDNITQEMRDEEEMRVIRSTRDRYLAECDWVVIKAYSRNEPVPQEWADYMQALRDLPNNHILGSPVVFPEKP